MPDLHFQVDGIDPVPGAIVPTLAFRLRVTQGGADPIPVHGISLRCQLRIEPARRRYTPAQQRRLLELFGEPHRWGQTLRPMLWTQASANITPFTEATLVDLPVPCTFDFNVATTKYLHALGDDGAIPLSLLFSGTLFYAAADGTLQLGQIPWDKEATFTLPVSTWKHMMDLYYPDTSWLCLRRDALDRLAEYKARRAFPTWEQAVESLLDQVAASTPEEQVAP